MIKKAQKEDLEKILELQYLAYQSKAKLLGNMDIPPLKQTIEEVYEPYLIKEGFIKRTPRGREVTDLAYKHLGRSRYGDGGQGTLF